MTTIAITGPTGILGQGLVARLQADDRVDRVIGVVRRDVADRGKLQHRRADVRDRDTLTTAFGGADAVVHLAFAKFGHASRAELHAVNVDGTLNAFDAAAAAGVRRFVFASSAAAYGFDTDRPSLVTEGTPARGSSRWFYSREKAELETRLRDAAARHDGVELTILRPTIVVGPHTAASVGDLVPPALRPLGRALRRTLAGMPRPTPALAPPVPLQFVHEDDVSQAFALALIDGPGGTFNLAGDGVVDGRRLLHELGLVALPVPSAATRTLARAITRLPRRPAALEAAQAFTRPVILDCARAKRDLEWRPAYTSLSALRAAVRAA